MIFILFLIGNLETAEARHKIATECLQDMIKWLQEGGQVGIYDASNTTQDRRKEVHDILISHNVHVGKFKIFTIHDLIYY